MVVEADAVHLTVAALEAGGECAVVRDQAVLVRGGDDVRAGEGVVGAVAGAATLDAVGFRGDAG